MAGDQGQEGHTNAADQAKADTVPAAPMRPAAHSQMDALEGLITAGDWPGICRALGPPEQADALPPNLGLIYAVALYEAGDHDQASIGSRLGIRCVAALASVPADSAVALVLAKRMLRRNPVAWGAKPAPSAGFSVFFLLFALVFGSAIGWLLSSGLIRFRLPRW
jgi:hypothetical protein